MISHDNSCIISEKMAKIISLLAAGVVMSGVILGFAMMEGKKQTSTQTSRQASRVAHIQ